MISQSRFLPHFRSLAGSSPALPSNSISQMSISGGTLWIGTSKGLARSTDGAATWESYRAVSQFANLGIFALTVNKETVWTSTGFSKDVNGASVQTGSGYTYSTDNGATWTHIPQTLDGRGDSILTYGINTVFTLPIVVPEQNVTFDMSFSSGTIWIASWSSGVRRSTNRGATWERIILPSKALPSIAPTDTLGYYYIDPRTDNNFLAFSVLAQSDSIIWVGTAGGINKSTDGGISWHKFTSLNQVDHILSDWVISVGAQKLGGGVRVWCTNWPAEGESQQYGVSATDDGGRTWKTFLPGIKAYGFAFRDSIAYVATTEGLYRTADGGISWQRSGAIAGILPGSTLLDPGFFAVAVAGTKVFGGTSEGLVATADDGISAFGTSWEVFRAYKPLVSATETYAYPNPFTPSQEEARFHYKTGSAGATVTIEVFDFGMNRVRTVVRDAGRPANTETDERWDGRNDRGNVVPNGVYFYRVTLNGEEGRWGKIMVLQ